MPNFIDQIKQRLYKLIHIFKEVPDAGNKIVSYTGHLTPIIFNKFAQYNNQINFVAYFQRRELFAPLHRFRGDITMTAARFLTKVKSFIFPLIIFISTFLNRTIYTTFWALNWRRVSC